MSFAPVPALAQDEVIEFGKRLKGGPYRSDVFVNNDSCPGTHTVQLTFQGGNWYRIVGQNPVRVKEGETQYVQAYLDLARTPPGQLQGTLTFACLDCTAPACTQSKTTVPVRAFVVERDTAFGTGAMAATDAKFGGLVSGQPAELCDVLKGILNDLEKTPWGAGTRGARIIAKLRAKYVKGDCSGDMTFVAKREVADASGNGKFTEEQDKADETPNPDEAAYVRQTRIGNQITGATYVASEEIYVGVDQRLSSIDCARQDPASYFAFTHKGQLGVSKKTELVHSLIHEGLHATNEGGHNVPDKNKNMNVSLEEEQDAFAAGDEACTALGLPPTGDTAGPGYHGVGSNPAYPKLK